MTKRVSTKKEEQLLPGLESSQFITGIRAFIDGSEKVGKHPLFVLGSGVSQGVVPMTWEIAQWLLSELKRDLGES
ncbi:MAG TPA: hypothetical protein VHP63_00195, partial [candidate division Zixibacteria bacterium]|nr:hypothetical protein [candidate division Zixibacteria bacterium]